MKRIVAFALVTLAVSTAYGDRFLLKDNTVRVGKLTGMHDGVLLANIQGRVEQIPASSVAVVIFDDMNQLNGSASTATLSRQPTPETSVDPISSIVSPFSKVMEGFKVELERCTKQGGTSVICNFRVTNLQPDRNVALSATDQGGPVAHVPSKYVDDQGMMRTVQEGTLGTGQGRLPSTLAVTDVAIRGRATFPGVETGVNSLAKLWIVLATDDYHKIISVEFRKVPLQGN